MKRVFLPALFSALPVLWVSAAQVPEFQGKYEAPEGFSVEGVGVCAPTDQDVTCWDMRRNPAPRLTELVRAKLLVDSNLLRLRFRKKNRILVTKASPGISVSYTATQGDYLAETQLNYESSSPSIRLLSYSGDPSEKVMSVRANVQNFAKEDVYDLPAKPGALVRVENSLFDLLSVMRRKVIAKPNPNEYSESSGLNWEIRLKGNLQVSAERRLNLSEWIDASGKAVQTVDKSGKPVQAKMGMQLRGSKYSEPSSIRFSQASAGEATVFYTNVDPKYLSLIRFRTYTSRQVVISGFPLDPLEQSGL